MRTAVDTNIPSEVLHGGGRSRKAAELLQASQHKGTLVISPVAYAELLASPLLSAEKVRAFLQQANILLDVEMNADIWEQAGLRFGKYSVRRKRVSGGQSKRLLADFIIGAHALLRAERLLTFDTDRYRIDFPELELVEVS